MRDAPLEQPDLVDAPETHRLLGGIVPRDLDALGVGLEHPDHAGGLAAAPGDLVVAEQRTRFGVARVHQRIDLGRGQCLSGGHRPSLATGRPGAAAEIDYSTGLMRQIRSAYSRMLRSLEKMPMPTVFSTALRVQVPWSRYSASTRSWAAQ